MAQSRVCGRIRKMCPCSVLPDIASRVRVARQVTADEPVVTRRHVLECMGSSGSLWALRVPCVSGTVQSRVPSEAALPGGESPPRSPPPGRPGSCGPHHGRHEMPRLSPLRWAFLLVLQAAAAEELAVSPRRDLGAWSLRGAFFPAASTVQGRQGTEDRRSEQGGRGDRA